jgi:hypothetical protein
MDIYINASTGHIECVRVCVMQVCEHVCEMELIWVYNFMCECVLQNVQVCAKVCV